MDTEEIRSGIAFLGDCLRDLDTRAAGRDLTETEQADFDACVAERAKLLKLAERHNIVAEASRIPELVEPGDGARFHAPNVHTATSDPYDLDQVRFSPTDSPQTRGRQLRDLAMRAVEKSDFASDSHRDSVDFLLRQKDTRQGDLAAHILATGSNEYREAFAKVTTGRTDELSAEERKALTAARAMSLTSANGGYAVPFALDPTIILTSAGTINDLRAISTVKTTVVKTWHGVTSAGVTAAYAAEATETSDNAPTLAQPAISAERAQAFIPASIEAEEDIANLASDITMLFADAKDILEATKFTVGSGTNEPKGIVTAVAAVTASRLAATTNDAFGKEDVYALLNAVPARHRKRASWLAQNAIYQKIRQFDTYGGSSFWTDLNGDTPAKLLGKPTYEAEDMDGVLGTGNDDSLLCGDFSKFVIVDRVGMSVEYIPHLFGSNGRPTGQRGWFCIWRSGSDVVDVNAFRLLRI